MPLTPSDVANKQFKVAFRGYSLDEVDSFLDEVESEITRLLRENSDLRQVGSRQPVPAAAPVPPSAEPTPRRASGSGAHAADGETVDTPPAAPRAESGSQGNEQAAVRMLQLAQRTADELVAEARAEADKAVGSARAAAERQLADAKAEAERLVAGARTRSQQADAQLAARVQAALGDLETRRRQLENTVQELRTFERDYRSRLKAYLTEQLRDLDVRAPSTAAPERPRGGSAPVAAGQGQPGQQPPAAAGPDGSATGATREPTAVHDTPPAPRSTPAAAGSAAGPGPSVPFTAVPPAGAQDGNGVGR